MIKGRGRGQGIADSFKVQNIETGEKLEFTSRNEFHRYLKSFGTSSTNYISKFVNGEIGEYKGFVLYTETKEKEIIKETLIINNFIFNCYIVFLLLDMKFKVELNKWYKVPIV